MNRIAFALVFGFAGIIACLWFALSMFAPNHGMAVALGVIFQFISSVALIAVLKAPDVGFRFEVNLREDQAHGFRSSREAIH